MSSACMVRNSQAEYLKETGIDFFEWQRVLLSSEHENEDAALDYLIRRGLSRSRAAFILWTSSSLLHFTGSVPA